MKIRSGPYILYNFALTLLSPLVATYLTQRYMSGKSKPGWHERWGILPPEVIGQPGLCPPIWIHAVSAGEVVAAVPILRELRRLLPERRLLLSVITPGGREIAEKQARPFVDALFYFPFDLPWVARRVVKAIHPQVFVSMESELWPNLMHELKRAGVMTMLVNGRITERNLRRIRWGGGGLFYWILGNMDRMLMQSEPDADRIRSLFRGKVPPGRIAIFGNSKFDQEVRRLSPEEGKTLRMDLGLPENAPIFVAGSTRSAEEEQEVLQAYTRMRAEVPDLCLIVAPRQIDRAEEVVAGMRSAGLEPVKRTHRADAAGPIHHLVLDTLGELANVYALSTVAFVGNSFPPVVNGGGQNLLQPLAHGKPVIFGPYTATCRAEADLVLEQHVGFRVENGAELASVALRILQDAELRREIEVAALNLIAANRGVSLRYAQSIAELAR